MRLSGPEPGRSATAAGGPRSWAVRDDLVVVRLGGGAVVYDPVADALHQLDAVAEAVVSRLDGRPVDAVVRELGELTGKDPADIADRVLALVDQLCALGLLARPGAPARSHAASVPADDPRSPATPGHRVAQRYGAHGWRFAVTATDPALEATARRLLAPLELGPGLAEHLYRLERGAGERLWLWRDGLAVDSRGGAGALLDLLAWDVNQQAVRFAGPDRLLLHAAAVAAGEIGVLLSGPSGSGKSTLAGLLVRSGFDYLTDELVAVGRRTGLLYGYPRALSLRSESAELFPELAGPADSDRHVSPDEVRAGGVRRSPVAAGLLFLLERTSGPSRVDPVDAPTALVTVLGQTFGWKETPEETLHRLGRLVEGCECRRVAVGDDRLAAPLVRQVVLAVSCTAWDPAAGAAGAASWAGPASSTASAGRGRSVPGCHSPSEDRRS
jgi:Coenzyme PQQ synthesis protein D (PqqD)